MKIVPRRIDEQRIGVDVSEASFPPSDVRELSGASEVVQLCAAARGDVAVDDVVPQDEGLDVETRNCIDIVGALVCRDRVELELAPSWPRKRHEENAARNRITISI